MECELKGLNQNTEYTITARACVATGSADVCGASIELTTKTLSHGKWSVGSIIIILIRWLTHKSPLFLVSGHHDVLLLAAIIGGSLAGAAVLISTIVILFINRDALFERE